MEMGDGCSSWPTRNGQVLHKLEGSNIDNHVPHLKEETREEKPRTKGLHKSKGQLESDDNL
jgi:hypothetical protein